MTELDRLLRQIADGDDTAAVLARARQLLLLDERLPEELRRVGLDDDEPDVAATALLGVLGLDDGLFGSLLGEAVRSEASGLFDRTAFREPESVADPSPMAVPEPAAAQPPGDLALVTVDMLSAQEAAGLPPVAEAVRFEAGEPELSRVVLQRLGFRVLDVASAVVERAGEVEVADAVATRLGSVPLPISPALGAEAGEVDVAEAVLQPLGGVLVPVALAVRTEAGEIDISDAVAPRSVEVAAAVRAEAGTVDVWPELAPAFDPGWISGLFDGQLAPVAHRMAARRLMQDPTASAQLSAFADQGRELRSAIAEKAGPTPYIWGAIAPRIGLVDPEAVPGWQDGLVAAAVRETAGPVRMEAGVMDRIQRPQTVAAPPSSEPAPANNRRWRMGGLALAAALLVAVVAGRFLPMGDLMSPDGIGVGVESVDFAAAGEVQVEELSYDDEVNVMVTLPDEDGDRPLIIRINEEV